jgi:hypothetical protein
MNHNRFFAGKSVLITGASSGIGRTLALQLGALTCLSRLPMKWLGSVACDQ